MPTGRGNCSHLHLDPQPMTMGLVEWRVQHINKTSLFSGTWPPRGCGESVYSNIPTPSTKPSSITITANLILTSLWISGLCETSSCFPAFWGLEAKAYSPLWFSTSTWDFHGRTFTSFVIAGILITAASARVTITTPWNYYTGIHREGVAFPPSFNMSAKPDTQKLGGAILVASVAACKMFLDGLISFAYSSPFETWIHSSHVEIYNSSLSWLSKPHIPRSL